MTPPHAATPRALSLYPRHYRETYGAEIHEMYQDAVRGAGRWARCREELDIAAHALRLRTCTGPGHLLGRFVLALALGLPWLPLAATGAAVAAGYGMLGALAPTVVVLVIRSAATDGGARHAFAILLATAPWTLAPATTPVGAAVALVPAVLAYGLGAAVRAGRRRVRA
ncbi:hypothetical protein ABZ569_04225 [Streptomyces albus]|uniref:hypothetical protein n=1 Tax=Streptomyces albus TaxID=1888 RepID=UPI0033C95597